MTLFYTFKSEKSKRIPLRSYAVENHNSNCSSSVSFVGYKNSMGEVVIYFTKKVTHKFPPLTREKAALLYVHMFLSLLITKFQCFFYSNS